MKKGLSLLLAASMALSAFSTAFAAEKTAEEKFQELVQKNIFTGFEDGSARLDENMTRAQFAIVLQRLLDLEDANPASPTFSDVKPGEWHYAPIEAAVKAGLVTGNPDGTFTPKADVTYEQLAKLTVEALDLEVDADATVEGTVSPGMAGYVAAAIKAGLIAAQSDYKAAVKREVLVTATYSAEQVINPVVVPVTYGVKPVGVKKIEVTFGKAVDTSKVTLEVKKGSVPVSVSKTTFSEDKKSAVIDLAVNLTEGEYTVNATGASEEALSSKFSVENEKITKIELNGDTAAAIFNNTNTAITGAKITYRVYNQYGEDVTEKPGMNVNWHATLGTITSSANGVIQLDYAYQKDQTFGLTGYIGTTTVSKQIKVGDRAYVSTIAVKELFHKDKKELNTKSTFSDYSLILEAKDQYGNDVTAAQFNNDVYFYSSNPSVANIAAAVDANNGADSNKLGLDLAAPLASNFEGSAVVNFVPKFGGQTVSFTVNVVKAAEVTSVTLSYPETVIGAGETVDIPFTAADQFGKAVTSYNELNGALQLSGGLRLEQDLVTGNAILKYDAPAQKGKYFVSAMPKNVATQPATLMLDVKDAKVSTAISNYKGDSTTLAEGAELTLKAEDIVALDQYGLDVSADKLFTDYNVKVSVSDTTEVTINGGSSVVFTAKGNTATLKGVKAGGQAVAFEFVKKSDSTVVPNTAFEKTFSVVAKADIAEYVIGDVKPIYAGADRTADHNVTVDVSGKLSNGSKVVLPASSYSVTATVYGVVPAAGGKLTVPNTADVQFGSETDLKGLAVVIIDTKDGNKSYNKDITVTKAARKITKVNVEGANGIDIKDGVAIASRTEVTLSNLLALFKAEDQYGVGMSIVNPHVSFSSLNDADGDNSLTVANGFANTQAAISGVEVGDSFEITVVTANGIVTNLKVKVELQ